LWRLLTVVLLAWDNLRPACWWVRESV